MTAIAILISSPNLSSQYRSSVLDEIENSGSFAPLFPFQPTHSAPNNLTNVRTWPGTVDEIAGNAGFISVQGDDFVDGQGRKMSKSLGNFFTVRDVAEQFGYEPIRFLMISCQYRSPINYSFDAIAQCKASLERLYTCRDNLDFALKNAAEGGEAPEFLAKYKQPNMLTPICECIVKAIIRLCSRNRLSKERVLVEALMCPPSIGLS